MTTVVIFHSALGIRRGELDAADRLRAAGHRVLVPDLYDGRVFDEYEPAMAWADEQPEGFRFERALAAVADEPDGFVVGGFSMGSSDAVYVATKRAVSGVLQFSGLNPLGWFGEGAAWPAGVDSQSHQMEEDPFRDPVEQQAMDDVTAAGGILELFFYPGSGHLFTDPTLPEEYDAGATELLWSRVLPFVDGR
ncbi:dienelactone hydrolase [Conyzicola lurida]|uniref:Dienelactone hydrolase n=1 Tax=Conyzicola lurida TaxID=1172621 RepID=A0A841AIY5_9MICO|nr:dienelactone hydrolase family protein [Conyzicola lurida]MBB5842298.1 dienelactone hydrolase [Conyzicola lurida]